MKGGVVLEIVHETNIGFIYDVCQVIICKTAKREGWINSYVMEGREEADVEQLDKTLSQFEDIDPVWKLLTWLHPQKGRLLSKLYIDFMKNVKKDLLIIDFEKYILSSKQLRKRLCEWYLDINEISSFDCLVNLHKNSEIDDNMKLNLYEFFVAPEDYILTMQKSLQIVISEMKRYYRMCNDRIVQVQNNFKHYDIAQERRLFSISHIWECNIKQRIVSFSMINRYTSMRDECTEEGTGWILLGIDYDTEVEKMEKPLNLIGFGNALGDVTRLNILKEIHTNGEKTLTDLSKKFKLVNAVMLYHLDILRRERLLMQRHEGRKVYYWLNYSRLNQAILAILSEFGGELSENMEKTFFSSI